MWGFAGGTQSAGTVLAFGGNPFDVAERSPVAVSPPISCCRLLLGIESASRVSTCSTTPFQEAPPRQMRAQNPDRRRPTGAYVGPAFSYTLIGVHMSSFGSFTVIMRCTHRFMCAGCRQNLSCALTTLSLHLSSCQQSRFTNYVSPKWRYSHYNWFMYFIYMTINSIYILWYTG